MTKGCARCAARVITDSQLVTEARGNMSRAARAAGLDRTTLYRLIERHGLQRKRIRETTDPTSL